MFPKDLEISGIESDLEVPLPKKSRLRVCIRVDMSFYFMSQQLRILASIDSKQSQH
ncbi:hypothetical protein ABEB36_012500 [Hypothenemus hampei]|uniref:Uncharacterized protein n=1 Tax=Hypothenemus hampei TaxID=57062 RepID=A0ABD1EBP2_HYPHA